jgi:ribosome biogenesis protein ENP2
MQVISPNNVKIYNLSTGKSLPDVSFQYIFGILILSTKIVILSGSQKEKNGRCWEMIQVLLILKRLISYLYKILVINYSDLRDRIELIQDFDMPIVSNSVQMSPDGQYIFATGN